MRFWLLPLLGGCGFHPGKASDGSLVRGEAGPGAEAGNRDCTSAWFGPGLHVGPRRWLAALSTTRTERDPFLSRDELQIWFDSDRGGPSSPGGADVWTATRPTIQDDFGTPIIALDASSPQDDSKYVISEDGLSYAIASNRTGTRGGFDLWVSHRETGAESFPPADNAKLPPNIDDGGDQFDPWINGDATRLYYAPTAGGQKIFVATRLNATAAFGMPVMLGEVNVGTSAADPTLFDGERVIVFSAVAAANVGGANNTDLWFATRTDPTRPFDPPQHLGDLSTSEPEGDPWVSADGCHLYFAAATNGDFDLYAADVL